MKLYATESVGRYIAHFHRLGKCFLSKAYKDYDIGSGQYQFLVRLYLQDGISHDELTEKMSVDKATTTRAILKLEETGYVKRVLNKDDKRKYYIYLTEKALSKKDEILKVSYQWENKLTSCLSQEELDQLYLLLRKIAKNNPGCFFNEEKTL